MNFIRYIKNNIFTIGSCLLVTLFYLLVIGVTYALLSYNVPYIQYARIYILSFGLYSRNPTLLMCNTFFDGLR